MKSKLFKKLLLLIFCLFLAPLIIKGQEAGIDNPLKYKEFKDLINAIINFIMWVGIAVAPILVLIAGFNFMTAGGDPKKIDTAKKIILYTIIGLAIILMAKGLIGVINQMLGVQLPSPTPTP